VSFIEFQDVFYRYPAFGDFQLQAIRLSIQKKESVGLLGPNGAGKSTLLKLMAALLRPSQGRVSLGTEDVHRIPARLRAKRIAYVPQSARFTFPLSVGEIVEMGRHPHLDRFRSLSQKDKSICERALALCDALEFRDRSYEELSGGERQRVLLASALAQTPQLLLLDEPTLSLDLSHQVLLFEIIQKLHREEGLTVVVATHELNLAGRYLDRLVLLNEGKVIADGTPGKVLTVRNIKSVLKVEVDRLSHKGDFPYFVPKNKKKVKK